LSHVIQNVLSLHGLPVYALVFLFVFVEDAIFVGFVVPGETAAVLGGVTASLHHSNLPAMFATVVLAAIIGDSVGYEVGRKFGPTLLRAPILAKHMSRLDAAREFLARRGGAAVFLGRFTAFFRAVIPALCGLSGMRYGKFLRWNAIGGFCWGIAFVLVGYLAGHSYAKVEKTLGRSFALVVLALVVVGLIVWRVREHRREAESPPVEPQV